MELIKVTGHDAEVMIQKIAQILKDDELGWGGNLVSMADIITKARDLLQRAAAEGYYVGRAKL